jgi:hypothetical protein
VAQKPRTQASRPRALAPIGWDAAFTDLPPIKLPDGRTLKTLADCRAYMLALPERQQAEPRWQAAAAALLQAAEHGGPFVMIARVAVSRALNSVTGVDPPPAAPKAKKQEHWRERRKKRP